MKVYIDESKKRLVYSMKDKDYYFLYGHDQISFDDQRISVSPTHLYRKDKNIYMEVSLFEKIFFENKKSIKFENETAIIK